MLEVTGIHTYYGLSHSSSIVDRGVQRGDCLPAREKRGWKEHHHEEHHGTHAPQAGKVFSGGRRYRDGTLCPGQAGIGYVPRPRVFADLTVGETRDIGAQSGNGRLDKQDGYEFFRGVETHRLPQGRLPQRWGAAMPHICQGIDDQSGFCCWTTYGRTCPSHLKSWRTDSDLKERGMTVLLAERPTRSRSAERPGILIDTA